VGAVVGVLAIQNGAFAIQNGGATGATVSVVCAVDGATEGESVSKEAILHPQLAV